jgi:hypothetical protein
MNKIDQDELYQNLNEFLKAKGIELTEGSYAQHIRQGCNLLTEVINTTQSTVSRAKEKVDHKLDQLRQTIHEATAPKPPPVPSTPSSAAAPPAEAPLPPASATAAKPKRPRRTAARPSRARRAQR